MTPVRAALSDPAFSDPPPVDPLDLPALPPGFGDSELNENGRAGKPRCGKALRTGNTCTRAEGHAGAHYARGSTRTSAATPGASSSPPVAGPPSAGVASGQGSTTGGRPSRQPKGARPPSPMPGLWALGWAKLGSVAERGLPEPPGPAPGRVMQFTAVDTGERIHRMLWRSAAYRKVAGSVGGGFSEDLLMIFGPPLLTAVMAIDDDLRRELWPVLGGLLTTAALANAKAAQQQAEALAKVEQHAAQIDEQMGELADMLFAPREEAHDATAAADRVGGQPGAAARPPGDLAQ